MILKKEGKELRSYMDSLILGNEHLLYDLRDPKQYKFSKMMLLQNSNNNTYLYSLKQLDTQKQYQEKNGLTSNTQRVHDEFQNISLKLSVLAYLLTQNKAANSLAITIGENNNITLSLWVIDNHTGNTLYHGGNKEISRLFSHTKTQTPLKSKNLHATIYLQCIGTTQEGQVPLYGILKQVKGTLNKSQSHVAPVAKASSPYILNTIQIGFGRPHTSQVIIREKLKVVHNNYVHAKNHNTQRDHIFLMKIRHLVLEHLDNPDFGNGQLARKMQMSESQLFRKIKKATCQSTAIHIRSIRLQEAKKLLINSYMNISEIAYSTGFNDPSYFTRTFLKEFGTTPTYMRKKFYQEG